MAEEAVAAEDLVPNKVLHFEVLGAVILSGEVGRVPAIPLEGGVR